MASSEMRAYRHSCGGWYAAETDRDGYHYQGAGCVLGHRCYSTPHTALRAAERRRDEADTDPWLPRDDDGEEG